MEIFVEQFSDYITKLSDNSLEKRRNVFWRFLEFLFDSVHIE